MACCLNCGSRSVRVAASSQSEDAVPLPKAVPVRPGHSLQVASALKRVYIGLGWAGRPGEKIVDVDASCIFFSGGEARGAVYFGDLNHGPPPTCSIVHSGDVLTGQNSRHQNTLSDQERIFVWADRLDPSIDCLVFTANVYTPGASFHDLTEAYIRIVNVDTNQELGRLQLGSHFMSGNSLVFAKMYKYCGGWQFMGLGQPIDAGNGHGSRTWRSLLPAIEASGCAYPPLAVLTPIPTPEIQPPVVAVQKIPPQQPISVAKSPSLAKSTAAGTMAGIALFAGVSLTAAMVESGQFTDGVDFVNLIPVDEAIPLMAEMPLSAFEGMYHWSANSTAGIGDMLVAGYEVVANIASNVIEGIKDGVASAADAASSVVSNAGSAVADAAQTTSTVVSNAGSALQSAGETAVEGAAIVGEAVVKAAAAAAGGIAEGLAAAV